MSDTAPIAITMGDPAGIGPEITAVICEENQRDVVVYGCPNTMERAIALKGCALRVNAITNIEQAIPQTGLMNVIVTSTLNPAPRYGEVRAENGQAAFDAIRSAITDAKSGQVSGILTAPIHKEALSAAGVPYPGHTEMLADLGGADKVAMLLGNDEVRTVLVTIHCSMIEAIADITFESVSQAIQLAHEGARALGYKTPRVAVAGLNPHAGEGGLFGDEEINIIAPAIKAAQAKGINASGPWAGDTVFMQARKGQFDIVVAQYHDQGLIPVKYMGLDHGVNISLGLDFVRTSPDHGTAFDIAGKGIADPASMRTALNYARKLIAAKT